MNKIFVPKSIKNQSNINDQEIRAYYSLSAVNASNDDYDFKKQLDKIITEYMDLQEFKTGNAKRCFKKQLKKMILVDKPTNSKKYDHFLSWRSKQIEKNKSKQRDHVIKSIENNDLSKRYNELSKNYEKQSKDIYKLIKENEELKEKLKKYESGSTIDTLEEIESSDEEEIEVEEIERYTNECKDIILDIIKDIKEPMDNVKINFRNEKKILNTRETDIQSDIEKQYPGYEGYDRVILITLQRDAIKEGKTPTFEVLVKKNEGKDLQVQFGVEGSSRYGKRIILKKKKNEINKPKLNSELEETINFIIEDNKTEEKKPEKKSNEFTIKTSLTPYEEYENMENDEERIEQFWKKVDECIEEIEKHFIKNCKRDSDKIVELSNLFYLFHEDEFENCIDTSDTLFNDVNEDIYQKLNDKPFSILKDNLNQEAK